MVLIQRKGSLQYICGFVHDSNPTMVSKYKGSLDSLLLIKFYSRTSSWSTQKGENERL